MDTSPRQLLTVVYSMKSDFVSHTDVEEIELSTVTPMRRINDHLASIRAEARVQVAAPFPRIFRGRIESAQFMTFCARRIVEIKLLLTPLMWVGIV